MSIFEELLTSFHEKSLNIYRAIEDQNYLLATQIENERLDVINEINSIELNNNEKEKLSLVIKEISVEDKIFRDIVEEQKKRLSQNFQSC